LRYCTTTLIQAARTGIVTVSKKASFLLAFLGSALPLYMTSEQGIEKYKVWNFPRSWEEATAYNHPAESSER
jgi:hypothetical protein